MLAEFIGGPYDGMKLNHKQINAYCELGPLVTGEAGKPLRLFLYLPNFKNWERVINGKEPLKGGELEIYERKFLPDGVVQFHEAKAAFVLVIQKKKQLP